MQNPWYDYAADKLKLLNDSPNILINNRNCDFVLPADRANCADFEDAYVRPMCLQTFFPPVPYVGNPQTADVIILAANPGATKLANPEYDNHYTFIEQSLKSLTFKSDYPIHYLDERFAKRGKTPAYAGYNWWEQVIGNVIETAIKENQISLNRRQIIQRIAGIEWLPYHSNSFEKNPNSNPIVKRVLPSQEYTRWLVNAAIERKAQLVVIWQKPHRMMWEYFLDNLFPQSTIFTKPEAVRPKNLCSSHFNQSDVDKVVEILAK